MYRSGNFYPVKAFSFFCPVACGCRAGDRGCPDSCPAGFTDRNGQGQVMYSGLEPNPSPRNVPFYAWRYSSVNESWRPNITGIQATYQITSEPVDLSY